tara:strand:+ start:142 stop:507 length:366 start_codon:yes stop_codon:yes gene_type:complete
MRDTIIRYAIVAALGAFLSLLFAMEANAQAYNCGMFGMLQDMYGETYVARFNEGLETIKLESALTCESFTSNVEVIDVKHRRRNSIVWIEIEHVKFNDMPYRIKYPAGSWGILNKDNYVTK